MLANNYQSGPDVMSGLVSGSSQVEIAAMAATVASPQIFLAGDTIAGPAAAVWAAGTGATSSLFGFNTTMAVDLGPGSFMAFRVWESTFTQARYGYFEVRWNGSSEEFEILSDAYEDFSTRRSPSRRAAAVAAACRCLARRAGCLG